MTNEEVAPEESVWARVRRLAREVSERAEAERRRIYEHEAAIERAIEDAEFKERLRSAIEGMTEEQLDELFNPAHEMRTRPKPGDYAEFRAALLRAFGVT